MRGCIDPVTRDKQVPIDKTHTNFSLGSQNSSGMGPMHSRKFATERTLKALIFVLLLFFGTFFSPGPGRFKVRSTESTKAP